MNIYTVRDNLKTTIEYKQRLRLIYEDELSSCDRSEVTMLSTTIEFISTNIDELEKILADVEACCQQATNQSWEASPDRSGA